MQYARSALCTDVVSLEVFLKALFSAGARACMIRTVRKNKKKRNDWFDKECTIKKRSVKRLLKRFQRSNLRVIYNSIAKEQ